MLAHRQIGLNGYMRQADWFNRIGSLFKKEPARQNKPTYFRLTSCSSEAISTEVTDCRVSFKMMKNTVRVTNEPAHLM